MLPYLDADLLNRLLPFPRAISALRNTLQRGPSAITAPPRTTAEAPGGHVLIMPAADRNLFGVKIAGVAPDNPAKGLPRITGTYLLYDADTLHPILAIDGPALTLRRTAALSALAVDTLAPHDISRLLLYGTGPQAAAHLQALHAVRHFRSLAVSGRTHERTRAFADDHGINVARPADLPQADVVACCTSSTTPLFDGRNLSRHATIIAMGSHTPDARELDSHTLRGAQVIVEDVPTAIREAADIADALTSGDITKPLPLHEIVTGQTPVPPHQQRIFRSVGMAWEDLAIATAALASWKSTRTSSTSHPPV
ncbi:ornithine cyclodeaminase [Prauserella sp. PE36]|uniref:ornithine cyclodeaminase family protein n=1 Tax=Prauserella sp. PE36 TaxID=1504709 RepID=UPI000DE49D18|nr:ornithine cyclodeaminase family protein [Prauserella sp. PE36]RBM17952.1 ornithine cyclodeaminase [Prauserella sp. PE36]